MSTATAFIFPRSFPFCVEDISGDVSSEYSHVGNLTLAEVMAFAWNLETFTLTPSGTATDGVFTTASLPTFTLNPMDSDTLTGSELNDENMWFGVSLSYTVFASMPAIRQPAERICIADPFPVTGNLVTLIATEDGASFQREVSLSLRVGTDPSNAGKYRLYYRLNIQAGDGAGGGILLMISNQSATPGGYDAAGSGTITIAGMTINWYAYCTTGSTPSGIGFTASSTSFTY